EFGPMVRRVQQENPSLRFCISLPDLRQLIEGKAKSTGPLKTIRIDPTDPCVFQLSGGTTGIPKLIPRTHNDYAYNSKTAAAVCGVTPDSVL
ncbi:MAG: (2,3-dihydroxybenzoyl)adenylate synthase, partial [Betaproteobacteria bacterium]